MTSSPSQPLRQTFRATLTSSELNRERLVAASLSLVLAYGVFFFAQHRLAPVAAALVLAVELWGVLTAARGERRAAVVRRLPLVLVGLSVTLLIAVAPRLVTQAVAAGVYAVWRWWLSRQRVVGLPSLLALQVVVFEALFLVAAVWQAPDWVVLSAVWASSFGLVYSALEVRGERASWVMAATWALVAAEISWVLLRWLFVYTVSGGYLLVPQPVLVLAGLAYCYGSIYVSQRQGKLSRSRLTEYLLIGLILIAIVITGTPWRPSL